MRHAAIIDLNKTHYSEDVKKLTTELKRNGVTIITTGTIEIDQDFSLHSLNVGDVYKEEIEPYFEVKLVVSTIGMNSKLWKSKKLSVIYI